MHRDTRLGDLEESWFFFPQLNPPTHTGNTPSKRAYLRIYYSDYLGQPPLEKVPDYPGYHDSNFKNVWKRHQ